MNVKAILIVEDIKINVLSFDYAFFQQVKQGKIASFPLFKELLFVVESQKGLNLFDWSISAGETKQLELHILPAILGGKTRKLYFYDCLLTHFKINFSSIGDEPMSETLEIVAAGMKDDNQEEEYSHPLRVTYGGNDVEETVIEETTPTITNVNWIDPETKETIKETTYTKSIALTAFIEDQEGSDVTITITKVDGTAFKEGQNELVFNETINEDGTVELTALEIKEAWEDFKASDIDKLVAKVAHSGEQKKSKALKITPSPKVLSSFRPNDNWKGEFGFDWIRKDDTSLFMDNKFEDIVSKQYRDSAFRTLETKPNEYKGYYKKDATLLEDLKEKYKPFEVTWKKVTDPANGNQVNDKHYTEWLSLKKGKEAKVKIHIDVTDKADYLEFDDNDNFTITPKKIDIKNKTGTKKLSDVITVKCDKEFTTDQEIIIKAYKEGQEGGKLSGKINVWANDASKHKQKKVVFVQINTDINGSGVPNISNAASEKSRINKYLNQAYIELHPDSEIVDLDLTADIDFSRFVKNGKVLKTGLAVPAVPAKPATATTIAVPAKPAIPIEDLIDYLKKQLIALDAKYSGRDYFKAFYFAEHGYHPRGNLSGYSAHNADYVTVFKSANDQTAAHEFLHSFRLPHTFTNGVFTYEAKKTDNLLDYSHNIASDPSNNKRCSLYYWQWVKANNSIT